MFSKQTPNQAPKQMFWNKGRLFVVTGFNASQPADQSPLAQQWQGRWNTQYELSQLMKQAGYVLVQAP